METSGLQDNLTKFLATWGALVATLALGWNIYRDLLDRPRLTVTARVRRLVQSTDGKWYSIAPDLPAQEASQELFVVMDASNVGRRPIRLNGWGGNYHKPVNGKNSFVILPLGLPRTLKEGDSHTEFTTEINNEIDNIKGLFTWDTVGRNWYVPRRALRKLKKEYHHFKEAQP